MATPKRFTMGVDSSSPSPAEERERIAVLRATVEKYLPEFAKTVARFAAEPEDERSQVMMHQDALRPGMTTMSIPWLERPLSMRDCTE